MRSGGCTGSGRALRLDPSGLPVRFFAGDAAAEVELHGERVAKTCASAGTATAPRNSKAVIVIRMPEDSHHRRQKTKGDGCECLTRRIAVNAYSAP